MTNRTKKMIYVALIGALLIPLSMVSRPSTRSADNTIGDGGGVLSQIRHRRDLSSAKISEINPASETMKLASLGLRGLAVNLLWMNAHEAERVKDWDQLTSTLDTLVNIQPNFIKVWEFQGHNLAFNVSMEFDDYEQRYEWVKRGILFLTKGIPHNRRDHRIVDALGFFCGQKLGRSDEKKQYRRLFQSDAEFHEEMSRHVNVENISTPHGADTWLLAYEWYQRSRRMREDGVEGDAVRRYGGELLYYARRPMQIRLMGQSLLEEVRSDEFEKANWQRAYDEWLEYGKRPLRSVTSGNISLEGGRTLVRRINERRAELDELLPGIRTKYLRAGYDTLTEEQKAFLKNPVDSLDDEQLQQHQKLQSRIHGHGAAIDFQIAGDAPTETKQKALLIARQIESYFNQQSSIELESGTVNYEKWRAYTKMESSDRAIAAQQAAYDARNLRRRSILNEYIKRDPLTGAETLYPGAIQKYEEAFVIWQDLIEQHPILRESAIFKDIVDIIHTYRIVREAAGLEDWIDDFPLQDVIDYRALNMLSTNDGLPTSDTAKSEFEVRVMKANKRLPIQPSIEFSLDDVE